MEYVLDQSQVFAKWRTDTRNVLTLIFNRTGVVDIPRQTDNVAADVQMARDWKPGTIAEATIKRDVLVQHMRVEPATLAYHAGVANIGAFMSHANNNGLHSANGIAAMFIATGQDAANVAESSAGIIYPELTPEGDLYLSLTIPSLIVATYGGDLLLSFLRYPLQPRTQRLLIAPELVALVGRKEIMCLGGSGHDRERVFLLSTTPSNCARAVVELLRIDEGRCASDPTSAGCRRRWASVLAIIAAPSASRSPAATASRAAPAAVRRSSRAARPLEPGSSKQ
jgi:hypothetical protein